MTFTHALATNNYGPCKFIVDASAANGTHTTIASATTSASSGDTIFIRPGTYTEDFSPKNGVTYAALNADANNFGVKIIGKMSFSSAVSASFNGLYFQTNSDNIIAITGTSNVLLEFRDCYFNASNNTAFSCTASAGSQSAKFNECNGDLGTTGITWFAFTRGGLTIVGSNFGNGAQSTTSSTLTNSSNITIKNSTFMSPITTSDTASLSLTNVIMRLGGGYNLTCVTLNGTGTIDIENCLLESGTSSVISVGAGVVAEVYECTIDSSNTNAITGAGTLRYGGLTFTGTSNTINTTTQTARVLRPGITLSAHQPAFLAYVNTQIDNITGDGTQYSVIFDTQVYNQNGDFDLGTSTFTAPYTGKYFLQFSCQLIGGTAISSTAMRIVTSNRTYRAAMYTVAGATNASTGIISVIADMDVSDTATFTVTATDTPGGKVLDIAGVSGADIRTFVSGYMVC